MNSDLLLDLDDLSPHGLASFNQFNADDEWSEEENRRIANFSSVNFAALTSVDDKLKQLIRGGIPCQYRRKIWFIASGGLDLYLRARVSWDDLVAVADKVPDNADIFFGSKLDISQYLPDDGLAQVLQFMKIVYFQNRWVTYSPVITSICLFLLLFMEPPMAYWTVQAMIEKSKTMNWYIANNACEFNACAFALRDLGFKTCKSVLKHAETTLHMSICRVLMCYIPTFFLPATSIQAALTVFDSFVSEGRKIMTRVCLSVLKSQEKILRRTTTIDSFCGIFHRSLEKLSQVSFLQDVMKQGFAFSMSRSQCEKIERKFLENTKPVPASLPRKCESMLCQRSSVSLPPLLRERRSELSTYYPCFCLANASVATFSEVITPRPTSVIGGSLLTDDLFSFLKTHMTPEVRCLNAQIVFKMTQDGTCLSTLTNRSTTPGHYIMLIQTNHKTVGVFISNAIGLRKPGYFGRSSMFVFDATGHAIYRQNPPPNSLFISVSREDIIVGGPRPALYLSDQFKTLQSSACETFGSPSLVVSHDGDDVYEIELYRMTM